jgi:Immunity protein 21
MEWIKSAGGPLVCLEKELARHWHGIFAGPGSTAGYSNNYLTDYGRACQVQSYLRAIDVAHGAALILGDMPLSTSVWSGNLAIVRIFYCDPGTDIPKLLTGMGDIRFDEPVESINFELPVGRMILFDSAYSGDDKAKKALEFNIPAGNYRILTSLVNPNSRTSLLLHKFFPFT